MRSASAAQRIARCLRAGRTDCALRAELVAWSLSRLRRLLRKQEAAITGLFALAPHPRTPQAVVAALLPDAERPKPVARRQRAATTLKGQTGGMRRLAPRVVQGKGPHIQPQVALTDGAEALPQQVVTQFLEHTLLLDISPATEFPWDTANALLGATHPQSTAMGTHILGVAAGGTDRPRHHRWKW